ncbi:hypothetical protein AURDEDRAFT_132028 [Auricularia subglabra TFB-10046 SS5]|uniref:Uncharacterized protein n=1 Tax=Auricularia subglabra (strain TFB-10046 / SS5) TaxID=717982 RepID=J0L8N0_AURST|nr:hypothetical protein AURDEDRAFT_132028 [Auricularia subglabra TFB-10046 SS5]
MMQSEPATATWVRFFFVCDNSTVWLIRHRQDYDADSVSSSLASGLASIDRVEEELNDHPTLTPHRTRYSIFMSDILALADTQNDHSALAAIMNKFPAVDEDDGKLWLAYMKQCRTSGTLPCDFIMDSFPTVSWAKTIRLGNGAALVPTSEVHGPPAIPGTATQSATHPGSASEVSLSPVRPACAIDSATRSTLVCDDPDMPPNGTEPTAPAPAAPDVSPPIPPLGGSRPQTPRHAPVAPPPSTRTASPVQQARAVPGREVHPSVVASPYPCAHSSLYPQFANIDAGSPVAQGRTPWANVAPPVYEELLVRHVGFHAEWIALLTVVQRMSQGRGPVSMIFGPVTIGTWNIGRK